MGHKTFVIAGDDAKVGAQLYGGRAALRATSSVWVWLWHAQSESRIGAGPCVIVGYSVGWTFGYQLCAGALF